MSSLGVTAGFWSELLWPDTLPAEFSTVLFQVPQWCHCARAACRSPTALREALGFQALQAVAWLPREPPGQAGRAAGSSLARRSWGLPVSGLRQKKSGFS